MRVMMKDELVVLKGCKKIRPILRELEMGDIQPVDLYDVISSGNSYSFLLESLEGEEKTTRYSILGFDPLIRFESMGSLCMITGKENSQLINGDPVNVLKGLMSEIEFQEPHLPLRFSGGCVGYFGYDVVRFFEHLPDENPDDLGASDAQFIFPQVLVIFDHKQKSLHMIYNRTDERLSDCHAVLDDLEQTVIACRGRGSMVKGGKSQSSGSIDLQSNLSREQFEAMVERSREYIFAGDIFQVLLSQRFQTRITCDPLNIFRTLRSTNPSPYMYYLNFDQLNIIGSSPEVLVRVEDGLVETRPLAGTRPRGKSDDEDETLIADLKSDEKEVAEHIMLVDLGRNDIGRVCDHGSVKVTELLGIEKYSHVMHLVSHVTGTLKRDNDAFDVLRAAFPAGTVSGAPKIRAMEIIDELEPTRRGIYAGAVGYVSFNGNLDTCIAIRTIVVIGNTAYIQAGAGIVADSVPEREYRETVNKAQALVRAIEIASRYQT
jgi:anthranilate synthase component 1